MQFKESHFCIKESFTRPSCSGKHAAPMGGNLSGIVESDIVESDLMDKGLSAPPRQNMCPPNLTLPISIHSEGIPHLCHY